MYVLAFASCAVATAQLRDRISHRHVCARFRELCRCYGTTQRSHLPPACMCSLSRVVPLLRHNSEIASPTGMYVLAFASCAVATAQLGDRISHRHVCARFRELCRCYGTTRRSHLPPACMCSLSASEMGDVNLRLSHTISRSQPP